MEKSKTNLSVVIPVFNDEGVLNELYNRIIPALHSITDNFEILFVDDGSKDSSWKIISRLKAKDSHVVGIKLIRNFGQQNAIAAGLQYVSGDVIILMDSDLQDKPEDIHKLIAKLKESDASMVIARWKSRQDRFLKKAVSKLFYKVSNRITKINHQPNLGVFRAMRRETIDELQNYQETTSTTLSLLYYIGVDYTTVELERDHRLAGKSGYNLKKMFKLSFARIFSFSMFPIKAAIYSGLIVSLTSFIMGVILILRYFFEHVAPGWTSIFVLVLFLFGINFLFLGIIGEYLGRTFMEAKKRPKFIVKKII